MPLKESIRICVLGQVGVGKSSLTLQFTQSHFPTDFDPTIEDVYDRDIKIQGKRYTLHVLDTAVQDEYSSLKDVQVKEADGFMIVYDVASVDSFSKVPDSYRHIMRVHDVLPPTVLIANQTDRNNMRQVSTSHGEGIAKEFELNHYFEASAKANINVNESFMALAEAIIAERETKAAALAAESAAVSDSEDYSEGKPFILRAGSPADSQLSAKRRAFTIGASLERPSIEISAPAESSLVAPKPTAYSRMVHEREYVEKEDQQKQAMRAYKKEKKSEGKPEKESKGGCCIVM